MPIRVTKSAAPATLALRRAAEAAIAEVAGGSSPPTRAELKNAAVLAATAFKATGDDAALRLLSTFRPDPAEEYGEEIDTTTIVEVCNTYVRKATLAVALEALAQDDEFEQDPEWLMLSGEAADAFEFVAGIEPGNLAEAQALALAYCRSCTGSPDINTPEGLMSDRERMAWSLARGILAMVPPAPDRAAWDEAKAVYEGAVAHESEVDAKFDVAAAAVDADAPIPEALGPKSGRWLSESMISGDFTLSFDRKAELMAILREWRPRRDAAMKRHDHGHLAQESEAAFNRMDEARLIVLETPAPDLEAVAYKQALILERSPCLKRGEDAVTPAVLSHILSDPEAQEDWQHVVLFQDVLRLSGDTGPLTTAKEFDADAWVSEWNAQPGHGMDPLVGPVVWTNSSTTPPPPDAFALWRALLPWQQEVIAKRNRDPKAQRSTWDHVATAVAADGSSLKPTMAA